MTIHFIPCWTRAEARAEYPDAVAIVKQKELGKPAGHLVYDDIAEYRALHRNRGKERRAAMAEHKADPRASFDRMNVDRERARIAKYPSGYIQHLYGVTRAEARALCPWAVKIAVGTAPGPGGQFGNRAKRGELWCFETMKDFWAWRNKW